MAEKGELLDALLTARPDLRGQAEELATRGLSGVDPIGVADGVETALRSVEIDELNGRAGHRPGIGYVHPVDAAAEILDEMLQPFLDDLQRHAQLGMTAAAVEMAVGILHGLHRCRDGGSESLLEHSPDFADERAGWSPAGVDGTHRYATAALSVFWPEEEFRSLVARWPHVAAHVGATWDEHRRRVERHCALLEQQGLRVQQLQCDVPGFATFLAARKVTKPGADDFNTYPDLRTVTIPMTAWPPARMAPCWCGSGRKYKQCCRRHGLGTLDFGTLD